MPTMFERQCLGALKLASRVIGQKTFRLNKVPGQFSGVFNALTQERELDLGNGRKTMYGAVLVCALDQWGRNKPSLGIIATVDGRSLRIVKIEEDAISITLYLGNVNL